MCFFFLCVLETAPVKYIWVNKSLTFYRAKMNCRSRLYRGLASVRNQTEQEVIAGLVSRRSWIGLNRKRFTHWSNHRPVNFTNWNTSQPDIPENFRSRCVRISASTGKWLEGVCHEVRPFVCNQVGRYERLKLKLVFRSSVDMNDPAVRRQITEQVGFFPATFTH